MPRKRKESPAGRRSRVAVVSSRDLSTSSLRARDYVGDGRPRTPEEKGAAEEARERQRLVREKVMLDAGVKKIDVVRALERQGVKLSHTTISNVVAGTTRNADVEEIFCALTRTDRAAMFPATP